MSKVHQNIVGFSKNSDESIVEYLPYNEQFSTIEDQRSIFFSLYNHYIESDMRLSKKEIKNGENIYEVFLNKITNLACCTYMNPHYPNMKLRCNSQPLINSLMLQSKFKQLIDLKGKTKLLFDLNDMFLHLVYERAKKVNPEAKVTLLEKSVLISYQSSETSSSLLIPSYMKLNSDAMQNDNYVQGQIDEVCKTLKETEIKNVYLVYPKHPKFTKHIQLDLSHKIGLFKEEYKVKMIPYSFSFCTKKQKKSKRNLNKEIACQSL
jgi:hypothetical protein